MNQLEFQRILGSRKISIHYGVEEFRQDLKTLEANQSERPEPTQAELLHQIEQHRSFCPANQGLPDPLTLLQEDRAR